MSDSREYGAFLKAEREKQGLSLEKISQDTRISVKVLTGLECMDKTVLPSETYRLGMIKFYARYLKIDETLILDMLRLNEIQESPITFDVINLQHKRKQFHRRILIISIAFAVVLGIIFLSISKLPTIIVKAVQAKIDQSVVVAPARSSLTVIDSFIESNFEINTQFLLVNDSRDAVFTITSITPPTVTIDNTPYKLEANIPNIVSLKNDNVFDYVLLLRTTSSNNNNMLLRIDPNLTAVNNTSTPINNTNAEESFVFDGDSIQILEAVSTTPIIIDLTFNNYSYYKIVSKNNVIEEGNATNGETKKISLLENAQLYLSNTNSVVVKVNGRNLTLPQSALPSVIHLAWFFDSDKTVLQATPIR